MQIRQINPAENPADLAATLPVFQAVFARFSPGFPIPGEARLRFWSSDGYRHTSTGFGAFEDEHADTASGVLLYERETHENLDLASAFIWVDPAARRRGIGSALFRESTSLAQREGRTRLATNGSSADDATGVVAKWGGRKVETATRSVLELASTDRAELGAWAAPSAKNSEYELVEWTDHCPDELAGSLCAAMVAMEDAPLEDYAYEHPKHDLQRLRALEEHSVRFGVRRHVWAAVDAGGQIAGFNMYTRYPDEPEVVDIWDTGVVREHRGHGLGLRVKSAATLQMLDIYPEARYVHTFNNHGNEFMLGVNRAIGYKAAENWNTFEFAVKG